MIKDQPRGDTTPERRPCEWRNRWADSGDRGRAFADHARECPECDEPVPLARLQESNPARWGTPQ